MSRWLWLLAGATALAQAGEQGRPAVDVYSTSQISVPPYIEAITQDRDGRIYFAAANAVVVYDGAHFHPNLTGVTTGGMHALLLDCQEPPCGVPGGAVPAASTATRLYAATDSRLGYFEVGAQGDLGNYVDLSAGVPAAHRQFVNVYKIARIGDTLWIKGTIDVLALRADGSILGYQDPTLNQEAFVHDGELHVVSREHGLQRLRIAGEQIVAEAIPGGAELAKAGGGIGTALDDARSLIVASLGIWRLQGRSLEKLDSPLVPRLDSATPTALIKLRDGRVALGTLRDGVHVLDADGQPQEHYGVAEGLPRPNVRSLHEDPDRGLWLGMTRALVRIDRRTGISYFGADQGIEVTYKLVRHQGQLFVASDTGLFQLRSGPGASAARFELFESDRAGINDLASSGEWLWVNSGGLFRTRLDVQGKLLPLQRIEGVRAPRALLHSRFHPERVFVTLPGALLIVDAANSATPQLRRIEGLEIRAGRITEADAETVWLSDGGHHIYRVRMTAAGDIATRFLVADGLPASGAVHAAPGIERPWFFGFDGLLQFDEGTQRFAPLSIGGPLDNPKPQVFRVDEDAQGNLWVRARNLTGVYWREAGSYRWDASPFSREFSRGTSYQFLREDSVVWIARIDGVARLDLAQRQPYVGQAAISIKSDGDPATEIGFRYGLSAFEDAAARSYRSRLVGSDADWSEWSPVATRRYMRVPAGTYRFEVEATDSQSRTYAATSTDLVVAPHWTRTRLAYSGYGILALLALYAAARLGARRRGRKLLLRQRELEAIVANRTESLAQQNLQLAEQALALKRSDELKTRFFVNVGHEFRTPLTLVMGPLDDVLRDPRTRLAERTREQLELANRNARRVLDLIVELLDVNRLEHGQLPLKQESVDLVAMLQRLVDDSRALVARFGHRIELDSVEPELRIAIDPQQIERVLANLIGNAAKFTARGGSIHIALARETDAAVITVRDNGRGIAPEALPHVFDRFYRAADAEEGSGFGVGLALSREIVERHGGRIEVSSVLGAGSEFRIRLPHTALGASQSVAAPVPATHAVDEPAPSPEAAGMPREQPLVLIVDDHPDLRLRLRQLLESRYRVVEAEDGPSALAQARACLPDVIVSDVMMPGFDGVELTRRLRAGLDTATIAILLLTAKTGSEHAVAGLDAGANDYLAKPFDSSELLARVGALLAQARRLQLKLAREPIAATVVSHEDKWRAKLDQVIAENLAESSFGVDELASAMHLDRSALFRRLKAQDGSSPADYLRERRLHRAHELLTAGAGNVSEIAYAVGFDSLSSFSRAFRTRFSCTPSELLPATQTRREARA